MNKIKKSEPLEFFVYEAGSVRGIPDVLISFRGRFIAWELKRSVKELFYKDGRMKLKGRTVLQWHRIKKLRQSGSLARFVYPENLEESLEVLLSS